MQLTAMLGDGGFEDFPEFFGQYFRGGKFAQHEVHIVIEVGMVYLFDDLLLNDFLQVYQVHHEASVRIDLTFNGYNEGEVMAVKILVGTFPKYRIILLYRPVGIV